MLQAFVNVIPKRQLRLQRLRGGVSGRLPAKLGLSRSGAWLTSWESTCNASEGQIDRQSRLRVSA